MKNKSFYLLASAFALNLTSLGLSSCSKHENEVVPATIVASNTVQVIDGRMTFKDFDAFKQVLETIKSKSNAELAAWEKQQQFSSLRANQGEAQVKLKADFGFPDAYAAFINASGEYRIGDKFYWYNAGKKHEFNSLADLQLAKSGVTFEHKQFDAGRKLVAASVVPASNGNVSALVNVNNQSGVFANYQYPFYLYNNYGSERKIVYETYVFTDTYWNGYHSVLAMNLKLEYKGGDGSWRVAGDSRNIDSELNGTCRAYSYTTQKQLLPSPLGPPFYTTAGIGVSAHTQSNSNSTFWLQDCYVGWGDAQNTNDIRWDFTINGYITSWVGSDTQHTYTVSGNNLW